jgi:predicted FMN-binding regulatory protein PaiB
MYVPKHFEGDETTGRQIMQDHGWALLMTADADAAPTAIS